ncbi:sugar ABC transporter ATP-binding protein [Aliidongia dinghuensis]|uniref:Sugar ABC transporter ATP-binding protein n=1 Tax=Aliidongia dinghuensis TaxID=1867774 RepID=A0A8J2YUP8_9PROT|nr:sugar ABC transporter ATP-binding protein [Aliidongia dinghuensis]GGF21037.1 sugar ABC transporter ATP-binding protein [Aliidongia dinghuensis]
MTDDLLLSMSGISKRYSGVPALEEASLTVARGEVLALIGQNGAGKSTLIKILTGAVARDRGTVQFDGRPAAFRTPQEAQAAGIATIYQEINLVPLRSVAENIFLGREPRRWGLIDWRRMHAEAEALLAQFDVVVDVRQPLSRLNTATRQMVAIARALDQQARLVVMDEPTSSLDDREVAVLFDVIRQLKQRGIGVIFVSHRLDELYAVCDRVTVMRDGRTVADQPMASIGKLELVASMLGRSLEEVKRFGATAFEEDWAPSATRVLEVEGLKSAPRVAAVDLDVREGEIVGLAGLLGSGRTETARAIFGADRAEAGTIRVAGEPTAFRSARDAIRAGIGFCSEDRKTEGIVPDMSVRDNLTLALLPQLTRHGVVDQVRQRQIVDRLIQRLGIRLASPDQKIRELSGGNQQKVLLARWLCLEPRLLILDEPTRGIDVAAKAEIQALIRELAREGLGVLMISSELEELTEGCHRVSVLRDGRSVAAFEHRAASEHAIMSAMAHGPAVGESHAGA